MVVKPQVTKTLRTYICSIAGPVLRRRNTSLLVAEWWLHAPRHRQRVLSHEATHRSGISMVELAHPTIVTEVEGQPPSLEIGM